MDRRIYDLRFNEDQTAFTCAMETGFRVYNTDPLCQMKRFDSDITGSIRLCGLIGRSQAVWIVCGGNRPRFPDNCVATFNMEIPDYVVKISYESTVTAVRMKHHRMVVSTAKEIVIRDFETYNLLKRIEVKDNRRGLLDITPAPFCDREIIVFPGCKLGSLQIVDITNIESTQSSTPATLNCHQNALACIALNREGTKVATSSVKGTLIRIWDTVNKTQLLELRRGCEPALIYSLTFNKTSEYLCCSSDKGTGHIFGIDNTKLNKQMLLGRFLGSLAGGVKSFATFQFRPESTFVCAFGLPHSIVIVGVDGTYNKYLFSLDGQCDRDTHDVFLNLYGDIDMYTYSP